MTSERKVVYNSVLRMRESRAKALRRLRARIVAAHGKGADDDKRLAAKKLRAVLRSLRGDFRATMMSYESLLMAWMRCEFCGRRGRVDGVDGVNGVDGVDGDSTDYIDPDTHLIACACGSSHAHEACILDHVETIDEVVSAGAPSDDEGLGLGIRHCAATVRGPGDALGWICATPDCWCTFSSMHMTALAKSMRADVEMRIRKEVKASGADEADADDDDGEDCETADDESAADDTADDPADESDSTADDAADESEAAAAESEAAEDDDLVMV